MESWELRFSADPIRLDPLLAEVRSDGDGALVVFAGVVRDHSRGKRVRRLFYEAWPEMATREMEKIFRAAQSLFGVERALVVHRTGELQVGQTSIAIVVASPHRAAGFDACRYLIDRLKESVPVWKKEVYTDGEAWIGDRS